MDRVPVSIKKKKNEINSKIKGGGVVNCGKSISNITKEIDRTPLCRVEGSTIGIYYKREGPCLSLLFMISNAILIE